MPNSVRHPKKKGKTLSSTHQPNKSLIALIVAARIAVVEVDMPRIVPIASTRRGRPKPKQLKIRVRKIGSVDVKLIEGKQVIEGMIAIH